MTLRFSSRNALAAPGSVVTSVAGTAKPSDRACAAWYGYGPFGPIAEGLLTTSAGVRSHQDNNSSDTASAWAKTVTLSHPGRVLLFPQMAVVVRSKSE